LQIFLSEDRSLIIWFLCCLIAIIFCFWLLLSFLPRFDVIDRCFSHDTVEEIVEALVSIVFVHDLMKNFIAWPVMKCNYETIFNLLDSYCWPGLSFCHLHLLIFFLKNTVFLKVGILREELYSKLFVNIIQNGKSWSLAMYQSPVDKEYLENLSNIKKYTLPLALIISKSRSKKIDVLGSDFGPNLSTCLTYFFL